MTDSLSALPAGKPTRRKDGRWMKRFRGKTHYFRGSEADALAWWRETHKQLTTVSSSHATEEGAVVRMVPVWDLFPTPENDEVYGAINRESADYKRLQASIREAGRILVPLSVSADNFIIAGNTRYDIAIEEGIYEVPCIFEPVRRSDDIAAFKKLLVTYNEQRVKSVRQTLREEAIKTTPEQRLQEILTERAAESDVSLSALDLGDVRPRSKIDRAKRRELIDAVLGLFEWIVKPSSDRYIHYQLGSMTPPPIKNLLPRKSKRNPKGELQRYALDDASYNMLTGFLTQARMEGLIPWDWISDETRPVKLWNPQRCPTDFIRKGIDGFLKGYYRDLMQSQPHYIEVLAEKNTVASQIAKLCLKYTIPMTSGRGFCSARPRYDLAQRYKKSGKDKLILLIISDLDPSGMHIAESFGRSMRDEFGVANMHAVKVAVTPEHVQEFSLPQGPRVKNPKENTHAPEFIRRYGNFIYEVEALPNGVIQQLLDDAIRSVLDMEAFNREVDQEKQDLLEIADVRIGMKQHMESFPAT